MYELHGCAENSSLKLDMEYVVLDGRRERLIYTMCSLTVKNQAVPPGDYVVQADFYNVNSDEGGHNGFCFNCVDVNNCDCAYVR